MQHLSDPSLGWQALLCSCMLRVLYPFATGNTTSAADTAALLPLRNGKTAPIKAYGNHCTWCVPACKGFGRRDRTSIQLFLKRWFAKFTALQHLKMPDFIYCYWVINIIHHWKVIKQSSKISGSTDTMQREMLKLRECEESRATNKFVRCRTQQTETVLAVLSLLVTNPENYEFIKS